MDYNCTGGFHMKKSVIFIITLAFGTLAQAADTNWVRIVVNNNSSIPLSLIYSNTQWAEWTNDTGQKAVQPPQTIDMQGQATLGMVLKPNYASQANGWLHYVIFPEQNKQAVVGCAINVNCYAQDGVCKYITASTKPIQTVNYQAKCSYRITPPDAKGVSTVNFAIQ